jgi:hypothetical protein
MARSILNRNAILSHFLDPIALLILLYASYRQLDLLYRGKIKVLFLRRRNLNHLQIL